MIICTGGYEFSMPMIRGYLHLPEFASPGSPYNKDEYWEPPHGPWPGHRPEFYGMVKEHGVYRRKKMPFPIHAIVDEEARLSGHLWLGNGFTGQIENFVCSKDNVREIEKGYAVAADTIEDLASRIKGDPIVLQDTINRGDAAIGYGPIYMNAPRTLAPDAWLQDAWRVRTLERKSLGQNSLPAQEKMEAFDYEEDLSGLSGLSWMHRLTSAAFCFWPIPLQGP